MPRPRSTVPRPAPRLGTTPQPGARLRAPIAPYPRRDGETAAAYRYRLAIAAVGLERDARRAAARLDVGLDEALVGDVENATRYVLDRRTLGPLMTWWPGIGEITAEDICVEAGVRVLARLGDCDCRQRRALATIARALAPRACPGSAS